MSLPAPPISRRTLLAWLFACSAAPARAAGADDKGLLYQIEKKDTVAWLGGSLHRLRRADHPLPGCYLRAWRAAERVCFEVPPGELASAWFQRKLSELRRLPDKTNLEAALPPALWKATAAAGARLGISREELLVMRPWFAAWRLSETAWEQKEILTHWGMEEYFGRLAAREAKPAIGLEKASVLLDRLEDLTRDPDEQMRTLADTLRGEKGLVAEFEKIRRVWRNGDEAAIAAMFREAGPADSGMMRERNADWVKRIDRSPRDFQKTLILPGIGHLPGPDGMLAGLTAKGWRLTRW